MKTYLTTTQSLCRTCRRLIPAQVILEGGSVWFHKICPEHGFQKARVHGDADAYMKLGDYHSPATIPQEFATASHGCPDSCGLCPDHEQHVCLPILEITDHCNLECPVCLVDILSAMFQPAAYNGNGAHMERPLDATTTSDVIRGLKGAGKGTVAPGDFSPLPCSHPACFSLAFYLKGDGGRFLPIKQLVSPERYLGLIQNRAIFGTDADSFQQVTDAVYDIWAGIPSPANNRLTPSSGGCEPGCDCNPFLSEQALKSIRKLLATATVGGYSPRKAMETGERAVKSIFIHQFMDPDTFDLARARKCCQVYPQPDGRLMPACVFNNLRRGRS